MKLSGKYIVYALIALAIAAFYYWRYRTIPSMKFSEIKLTNEAGMTVTLDQELKDSTVVHFYASWCGPCLKELRELNQQFSQYDHGGIDFILITDDNTDNLKAISERMPEQIRFYRTENLQKLGIYSIPASYFVTRGEIASKHVNPIDWNNRNEVTKQFIR
jgi:thiol-disulfide isomerase/thioredoxin